MLKFYHSHFNYDMNHVNILIDGTFAQEALKNKINLKEQLPKYFDVPENKCRLLTTKCAIHETEVLGKVTYGAMLILKQYELVECRHTRNFVNSEKCIKNILNHASQNKDAEKYFIATQVRSIIMKIYSFLHILNSLFNTSE